MDVLENGIFPRGIIIKNDKFIGKAWLNMLVDRDDEWLEFVLDSVKTIHLIS